MSRAGRNVQIEIQRLAIEAGGELVGLEGDDKVKVNYRSGTIRRLPLEVVIIVQSLCEPCPSFRVGGRVLRDPDAEHVVNITT